MACQVPWNARIISDFVDLACLSEDEEYIIRTRCKGYPVSRQAMELHVSESTVAKRISLLKKKYDKVQKEYPDRFPVRKYSVKETWMDNN